MAENGLFLLKSDKSSRLYFRFQPNFFFSNFSNDMVFFINTTYGKIVFRAKKSTFVVPALIHESRQTLRKNKTWLKYWTNKKYIKHCCTFCQCHLTFKLTFKYFDVNLTKTGATKYKKMMFKRDMVRGQMMTKSRSNYEFVS